MNTIVIIDSLTRSRSKEDIPDGRAFTDRINGLKTSGGQIVYYGKNTVGGVSAIIEV